LFAGGSPYRLDGTPVQNLSDQPRTLALSDAAKDVVVERSFSNKRIFNRVMVAYDDFFDKIHSYAGLISGPAKEKGATPTRFVSSRPRHRTLSSTYKTLSQAARKSRTSPPSSRTRSSPSSGGCRGAVQTKELKTA
jgi:hypothetical protein